MQSEISQGLEEPSHQWMKCNINPAKVSAIINMQEQMIRTGTWKRNRGLVVDTNIFRVCGEVSEGVTLVTSGCKMLASREYKTRHNDLLKMLMQREQTDGTRSGLVQSQVGTVSSVRE